MKIKRKIYNYIFTNAGWSSLEARRAHNPEVIGSNPVPAIFAQLAQLVEQRTENPRVSGSIPELGIFYFMNTLKGVSSKWDSMCQFVTRKS